MTSVAPEISVNNGTETSSWCSLPTFFYNHKCKILLIVVLISISIYLYYRYFYKRAQEQQPTHVYKQHGSHADSEESDVIRNTPRPRNRKKESSKLAEHSLTASEIEEIDNKLNSI